MMKKALRLIIVVGVIFQFISGPVYAGWKEIVTKNQIKGKDYITQLKNGADPDKLERPPIRNPSHAKAKKSAREVRQAMDEAEALARAGKRNKIVIPNFHYKGVSEEREKEMEAEYKSN